MTTIETTPYGDVAPLVPAPDRPADMPMDGGFWESSDLLKTVYGVARASAINPWAALAATLVRVSLAVPPEVVLPPLGKATTGHSSLCLFVGLTGRSGGGKGLADAAARAALNLDGFEIKSVGAGSAEGIADKFVEWVDDPNDDSKKPRKIAEPCDCAVHITDSEIDKVASLLKRDGSALGPTLRALWGGEHVSFSYRTNGIDLAAHSYRTGFTLGVQLTQAGPLFSQSGGGTLQRFLWAPATNPFRDLETPPDAPVATTWVAPRWPEEGGNGLRVLPVAGEVRAQLWHDHVRRDDLPPEETRTNEIQLRVAALLSIAEGRAEVTVRDWQDAGRVIEVSRQTREAAKAELERVRLEKNREGAEAAADRAVTVAERVASHEVATAAKWALKRIQETPGIVRADLRRAASGKRRGFLDDAVDMLAESGEIKTESFEYQGSIGTKYFPA